MAKKVGMAIIPFGSIEQHGPHLPLNTDVVPVYEIAKRVSSETGAPVAPFLAYGASLGHKKFPGTVWLRPETLSMIFTDIVHSFYEHGVKKILALSGHGTNIFPLKAAWDNLRSELPDVQIKVVNWWEVSEEVQKLMAIDGGDHANAAETSLMLALQPELVHQEKMVDEVPPNLVFDYRVDQRSRTGVFGKPTLGNVAAGQRLLDLAVRSIVELVKKGLKEEIPYR